MNPGMKILGGRPKKHKNTGTGNRNLERNLLLLAGVYLLAGMMVLYLGLENGAGQVLIAGPAVTVAFFLVHLYWRWSGYRGDTLLLPVYKTNCQHSRRIIVILSDPPQASALAKRFCRDASRSGELLTVSRISSGRRYFVKPSVQIRIKFPGTTWNR
jgi:hypothetical protein